MVKSYPATCAGQLFCAVICLFITVGCQDFGYEGSQGPSHWGEKYSKCIGKHQSPIDIEEHDVQLVKFPEMHFENFNKHLEEVVIKNNGHTVQLSVVKGVTPTVHGGPLKGKYQFAQLHFHWGNNDTEGSENTINHNSFPLELHMVFFKTTYENFNNALGYSDGLVVLSFLYSTSEIENKHYRIFQDALEHVHSPNAHKELVNFVSLDKFTMKHRHRYFTYEGSLTTPPCSEVVTWIEFTHTIPLTHDQLEAFRHLSGEEGLLRHNFRPTQPLYDRVIRMNKASNSPTDNSISASIFVLIICNLLVTFLTES